MTTYEVTDLVAMCVRHTDDSKTIAAEVATLLYERDKLNAEKVELLAALSLLAKIADLVTVSDRISASEMGL